MKTISIEQPCHENWAAMTPVEQGAFCGKCRINVIDFSDKSPQEVKTILEENTGKHLCGRFKKTQLDELNERYADWENQDSRKLLSKFLLAVVLVFGMTLFSCNDDEMILGEVAVEQVQSTDTDPGTIREPETTTGMTNDEKHHRMGKVAYQPEPVQDENLHIQGNIAWIPDTTPVAPTVAGEIEEHYIKGEVAWIPPGTENAPECQPADSTSTGDGAALPDHSPGSADKKNTFVATVFPNPTRDVSTILVRTTAEAEFTIDLYEVNGQWLSLIYKGLIDKGEQRFDIPMAGYAPGNYLVTIRSEGTHETVRVQKIGR